MSVFKKGNSTINFSNQFDITRLENQIRRCDAEEVFAATGQSPRDALIHGLAQSMMCFTAFDGDEPYCMVGVTHANDPKRTAGIWLLGTDRISRIPKTFMKLSVQVISLFHQSYPVLYNFVDCRNTTSIRWLEKCGAEFSAPAPYGVEKLPFRRFILRKEVKACARLLA